MLFTKNRNLKGYSLLETMTVIVVLAAVIGLLYSYQTRGWKYFFQSYSRGLSQVKAKLAIRTITDDILEANKSRLSIGNGSSFGIPFPKDANYSSPYIYFTKPIVHKSSGEVIGYDYILYYFAEPTIDPELIYSTTRYRYDKKMLVLKSIKFLGQSKFYTEDPEKEWPFLPPLLERYSSKLPEDKAFIEALDETAEAEEGEDPLAAPINEEIEEAFLDLYEKVKRDSRNIPVSGNFLAVALTDPFTEDNAEFSFFGQDYKTVTPIKIKVTIHENPLLFGLKSATTEFELDVTPRN